MTERPRHARSDDDLTTFRGHHCPEGAQLMILQLDLKGEHACSVRCAQKVLAPWEGLHRVVLLVWLTLALWSTLAPSVWMPERWVAYMHLKLCCLALLTARWHQLNRHGAASAHATTSHGQESWAYCLECALWACSHQAAMAPTPAEQAECLCMLYCILSGRVMPPNPAYSPAIGPATLDSWTDCPYCTTLTSTDQADMAQPLADQAACLSAVQTCTNGRGAAAKPCAIVLRIAWSMGAGPPTTGSMLTELME